MHRLRLLIVNTVEFIEAFENTTLPKELWTHEAHVHAAWYYARSRPFDDALEAMRTGIQKYNLVIGVDAGDDSGYHETVTVAWMRIMHSMVQGRSAEEAFDEFLDAHPELLEKQILLRYYSRACLVSSEARAGFVEPDISSLPLPRT